jgi:hypothetical protein
MARKPLDLPMQVAKQFVNDMRAYHAEPNAIKRDEIAARQAWILHTAENDDKCYRPAAVGVHAAVGRRIRSAPRRNQLVTRYATAHHLNLPKLRCSACMLTRVLGVTPSR